MAKNRLLVGAFAVVFDLLASHILEDCLINESIPNTRMHRK